MKNDYEVIVIGGGIIGCSIAYELAKAGRSVLLIEKDQIGAEASSAAAGMLAAQLSHAVEPMTPFSLRFQLESRRLFPDIVKELERETHLDISFKEQGLLYLLFSKNELRSIQPKIRWQQRHALPVEWLSVNQVQKREPAIDQPFFGAFYFPKDPQVDNGTLTLAYAKAARKKGAQILLKHTVNRILVSKGKVFGVQTVSGRICRAPIVVNACGTWAGFDKNLPFRIPVFPVRGQILTFQFRKAPFHTPIVSAGGYCVPRERNRLLVGTTVEPRKYEKTVTAGGIKKILGVVSRFTSCLKGRTPYEKWAGLRPCTPDHLPIIGKTPIRGLYIATGHFRDGILLAPLTAKLMTEMVVTGKTPERLKPFSIRRFL